MNRKVLLLSALTSAFAVATSVVGWSEPAPERWKEPQDTFSALFEPDRYAWRLFVALNWPAKVQTREPDSAKPFGAEGPAVWESWRTVLEGAPGTVFPRDGSDPGEWLAGAGPVVAQEEQRFIRTLATEIVVSPPNLRVKQVPAPSFESHGGNEVRMNKTSYEFIRSNTLYNAEGQIAKFVAGEVNLNFSPNAKLVKARWRQIDPAQKARYHWAEITRTGGTPETWGLVSLHIITKDLPNWFWSTFEHIDNKSAAPGWEIPSVDRLACPTPPHGCEQAPAGLGLQGTKWENYRLRGTQTDFIKSSGEPTRLSNSVIEGVQDSSCMTCHSRATINRDGRSFGIDFSKGSPNPSWFSNGNQRIFMQQDFVFSLGRASRVNP
jgi:hypothetical protein